MTTAAKTKPYKAIGAFVVALLGSLAVGAIDNALTLGEALAALAAGSASAGAVYGITNPQIAQED